MHVRMNTNPHDNELRERIVRYAEVFHAPAFDIAAVRRRAVADPNRRLAPLPFKWRVAAGMVIVAALLAVEPGIPAITSGVTHALQAFVITDGQLHGATTRSVTLAQAQSDMPFHVIAPSALPASFHANITEVYPSHGRSNAQLWFRYSGSEPGMELTILETSPSSPYAPPAIGVTRGRSGNGEVIVSQSHNGIQTMVTGGAIITKTPPMTCVAVSMPPGEHAPRLSTSCNPPPKAPGLGVNGCRRVQDANGGVQVTCSGGSGPSTTRVTQDQIVTRRGLNEPMRWVSHGTLIMVFDPAQTLSHTQMQELRAAMSR